MARQPTYIQSTKYEEEILRTRMMEFAPAMVHFAPAAIQRYFITTNPDGVSVNCLCETNDDDDDGYPDGQWVQWNESYANVEQALRVKGACRVGISGVIVTVVVDGNEIR